MKSLSSLLFVCLVGCSGRLAADSTTKDPPHPVASTLVAEAVYGDVAALAVDATDVYWISIPTGGTQGTLFRAPKTGGVATLVSSAIASEYVADLELDRERAYVVSSRGLLKIATGGNAAPVEVTRSCRHAAVAAETLFWALDDGTIHSTPAQSGAPSTLVDDRNGVDDLTVDGSHIYWVRRHPSTLMQADLNGTNVVALDTMRDTNNTFVTLDDGAVYWGTADNVRKVTKATRAAAVVRLIDFYPGPRTRSDGQHLYTSDRGIRRIPVSGGNTTVVVTNAAAASFAIDDGFVYWAENRSMNSAASIRRIAK